MPPKIFSIPAGEKEAVEALLNYFAPIVADPEKLLAEVRRQGAKPHVRRDKELSFLLGLLAGYVERTSGADNDDD